MSEKNYNIYQHLALRVLKLIKLYSLLRQTYMHSGGRLPPGGQGRHLGVQLPSRGEGRARHQGPGESESRPRPARAKALRWGELAGRTEAEAGAGSRELLSPGGPPPP